MLHKGSPQSVRFGCCPCQSHDSDGRWSCSENPGVRFSVLPLLTQNGGNEPADPRGARLSVLLTVLNKKPGTRREQNTWVVLQF